MLTILHSAVSCGDYSSSFPPAPPFHPAAGVSPGECAASVTFMQPPGSTPDSLPAITIHAVWSSLAHCPYLWLEPWHCCPVAHLL